MNRIIYAAYGSNLNLEQMAKRCPTAKPIGSVTLKDYRLMFRGANTGAVATVEPQKNCSTPVLLWELTPRDEAALDVYEGYPSFYRKETIKVRFDKKSADVMIYIMNEGRPLGLPSRYYFEVIQRGYEDAGFDVEVLNTAVKYSAVKKL